MTESNQRAPRFVKNQSGYHSHGKTHKEKVFNFGKHIKQFGWSGEWKQPEGDPILRATMKRGNAETISIEWPDDQWWPDVFYSYAGETIKCRNISAAAKIAAEKPNAERMRKSVGKKRSGGRRIAEAFAAATGNSDETTAELIDALRTTLPFDSESTPEEIKAIIKTKVNPTIVWVNRLSGAAEQDYIKTWSRHLKITENKEGKKIINFVGGHQFHSVYVDSVIGFA